MFTERKVQQNTPGIFDSCEIAGVHSCGKTEQASCKPKHLRGFLLIMKNLFIPINSAALPLSMYVQQFISITVIYSFLDVLMFACFLVSYGYVVLDPECKSRVVRKISTKMIFYDVVAAAVFVIDASGCEFAREKFMHMSTNAHIYVYWYMLVVLLLH